MERRFPQANRITSAGSQEAASIGERGAQADLLALLGARCLLIVCLAQSNKKRNHYLRIAERCCRLAEAEELKQHLVE
jgi:hypothetical protein